MKVGKANAQNMFNYAQNRMSNSEPVRSRLRKLLALRCRCVGARRLPRLWLEWQRARCVDGFQQFRNRPQYDIFDASHRVAALNDWVQSK